MEEKNRYNGIETKQSIGRVRETARTRAADREGEQKEEIQCSIQNSAIRI